MPPARLLDRLGAREIRRVVLTHGHFDHAARAACFPRAHLLMARAELEAMRQALAGEDWNRGYRRRELEALEGLDLELLDGPVRRWGMEIEVVGGHTPGMLAVSWSPELLLAGDNAYLFANLQRPGPGPEVLSGLLARGQKLVPGHDFLLLERGSPCASGIVRLD